MPGVFVGEMYSYRAATVGFWYIVSLCAYGMCHHKCVQELYDATVIWAVLGSCEAGRNMWVNVRHS